MKFLKYSLVLCLVIVGIFFVNDRFEVKASGSSEMCWKKTDCENAGGSFYGPNAETISMCGTATGPMKKKDEIVFCYAGTKAKTTISFAGRNTFDGVGDFINFIYRYGVIVAGILATIMIIIAGFQRVTSAGSPDKIKASTTRIGNALMGLFLAVLSYFILMTLNPYLVNIRLPQVWMINTRPLVPSICETLPKSSEFAQAYTQEELNPEWSEKEGVKQMSLTEVKKRYDAIGSNGFTSTSDKLACGNYYFVKGGGPTACLGTFCRVEGSKTQPLNKVCAISFGEKGQQIAKCEAGNVVVSFVFNDFLKASGCRVSKIGTGEGWVKPAVDIDESKILTVCSNGVTKNVGQMGYFNTSSNEENQTFTAYANIRKIEDIKTSCENGGHTFRGLVIELEMNERLDPVDEDHFIGRVTNSSGENVGVDLGDRDWFEDHVGKINKNFFITIDDLLKPGGFRINGMNAAKICDIDKPADATGVYTDLLK